MTTIEQFKQQVARISPEATLTIRQACAECAGTGVVAIRASCRNCGHVFTPDEFAREDGGHWTADGTEFVDGNQFCGCDWLYRQEDDHCIECDGERVVLMTVTLQELAFALFNMQPSLAE